MLAYQCPTGSPPLLYHHLCTSSSELPRIFPLALWPCFPWSCSRDVILFAQPGTAEYLSLVLMVTLMVGLVQFVAGFIRAGYLMTFLSQAVINGFTYAAALVIFSSQFRHILGIDIDPVGSMAQVLYRVVLNIRDLNLLSLSLALTSIALILILEKKYSRFPAPLVVVVLGTMLTYFLRLDTMGVKVVGDIGRSFSSDLLPSMETRNDTSSPSPDLYSRSGGIDGISAHIKASGLQVQAEVRYRLRIEGTGFG